MIHPSVAAFEHNLVNYRRTWRGSVFSAFVIPIMFLLAMGKSVGGYVDTGSALGVSYLDFIAPGVLATTTFQIGVFESAYPVYSAFHWSRTFHAMRASPLRPVDMLAGQMTFVAFRITISGIGFLIVMALFGTVRSPRWAFALPAAVLAGMAVAGAVFAYSAVIKSDNLFALLMRFAMIPMSLFAGVFFPVAGMPLAARVFAYGSPLWHAVELCRAATLGTATAWGAAIHVGYLSLWCCLGFELARRAFRRAMRD